MLGRLHLRVQLEKVLVGLHSVVGKAILGHRCRPGSRLMCSSYTIERMVKCAVLDTHGKMAAQAAFRTCEMTLLQCLVD